MKTYAITAVLFVAVLAGAWFLTAEGDAQTRGSDKLNILWTSGDIEVFNKVVYPYGLNSKRLEWWPNVELIVWGPSAKLLAETPALQEKVKAMMDQGVVFTACKWCADQYEASTALTELGIEVKYMGEPLSDYLKAGEKVLTF